MNIKLSKDRERAIVITDDNKVLFFKLIIRDPFMRDVCEYVPAKLEEFRGYTVGDFYER